MDSDTGSSPLVRLGQLIQDARKLRGLGLQQAANRAGLDDHTWRDIEAGLRNPRDATRRKIEAVLGWGPGSIAAVLRGGDPTSVGSGIPTELGAFVLDAMSNAGLEFADVAGRVGVPVSDIAGWVFGSSTPTAAQMARLFDALRPPPSLDAEVQHLIDLLARIPEARRRPLLDLIDAAIRSYEEQGGVATRRTA